MRAVAKGPPSGTHDHPRRRPGAPLRGMSVRRRARERRLENEKRDQERASNCSWRGVAVGRQFAVVGDAARTKRLGIAENVCECGKLAVDRNRVITNVMPQKRAPYFARLLFPRVTPHLQRKYFRQICYALILGAIIAAVVVVVIYYQSKPPPGS